MRYLVLVAALAGCGLLAPRVPLTQDMVEWALGARASAWEHGVLPRGVAPPEAPLERVEVCGDDFLIVFFDASRDRPFIPDGEGGFLDGDLLWVAGMRSEDPAGADSGWTDPPERDAAVAQYRADHGPCVVAETE